MLAPDWEKLSVPEPAGTIYIIDDDPEVGLALARLLHSAGYDPVVFRTAIEFLCAHEPSRRGCLLLDALLPALGGLQLQAILNASGNTRPVIFLSGFGTVEMTAQALMSGAIDFLTKPIEAEPLLSVVEEALYIDAERHRARHEQDLLRSRFAPLTPREREVLERVISGRLNKQIAAELGTVEKTVKVHRSRVMHKLHVRSVAELVRVASEIGSASVAVHPAELLERVQNENHLTFAGQGDADVSPDFPTVATWDWDIPNNRVVADRNLARLFGLSDAVARGSPLAAFTSAIHMEDSSRVANYIRKAIDTGNDYEVTFRVCRPNGEQSLVLALGRVEYDKAGRPARFPGVVIDITPNHPPAHAMSLKS